MGELTELERELLQLLKEEMSRNDVLIQMMYEISKPKQAVSEERIVIPDSQQIKGKVSWGKMQERLEKLHAKSVFPEAGQTGQSEDEQINSGNHARQQASFGEEERAILQEEEKVL